MSLSIHTPPPGALGSVDSVFLRSLRADDWVLEKDLSRDPDVVRWTTIPADLTEEQARARVQRRLDAVSRGDVVCWIIEHGQHAVGNVGASQSGGRVEIFYTLEPSSRGKGLVAAAVMALVLSIESSGLAVTLATYPDNLASQKTARRAGFHISGVEARMVKGKDEELLTWSRPSFGPSS